MEIPPKLKNSALMARKIIDVLRQAGTPLPIEEISSRSGYAQSGVRSILYRLQKEIGCVQMLVPDDKHILDLDEILQFQSVKDWCDALKDGSSREVSLYVFYRFWQYAKSHSEFKSPDEMIDDALDSNNRGLVKHLRVVTGYANSLEDVSYRYQGTSTTLQSEDSTSTIWFAYQNPRYHEEKRKYLLHPRNPR